MSKHGRKDYLNQVVTRKLKKLTKSTCALVSIHTEPGKLEKEFLEKLKEFKPSIRINLAGGSFTFDALVEMAILFKTTEINVESQYSEGCPTCGGSTDQLITIFNPVITND